MDEHVKYPLPGAELPTARYNLKPSGDGTFMPAYGVHLAGRLQDYAYAVEKMDAALRDLPLVGANA